MSGKSFAYLDAMFEPAAHVDLSRTLTMEAAATLLNMSRVTLRRKAAAGVVPSYKPGKSYVFMQSELLDFLKRVKPCPSISAASIRPRPIGCGSRLAAGRSAVPLAQRIRDKRRNLKLLRETKPGGKPN